MNLDDESIPIHIRINECIRLMNLAVREAKSRGYVAAQKKAAYYSAKADECFSLLEAGHANTFIQQVIKGRPKVNQARIEWDMAEVEYKNANEAIQAFKLCLRVLEGEHEREWEQARRSL